MILVGPTETPIGPAQTAQALVRHRADPRLVLAGVLGVSAEDIRVREGKRVVAE